MKPLINEQFYQLDEQSQQQIIDFGFRQMQTVLLNTGALLLISIFLGRFIEGLCFQLFFTPLRVNAGGAHIDSKAGCFFVTIATFIVSLFLSELLSPHLVLCLIIAACSSLAIIRLAPVDTVKKRLDQTEQAVYRRRCLYVLGAELILITFFSVFDLRLLVAVMSMAIANACIALIAGYIANRVQ